MAEAQHDWTSLPCVSGSESTIVELLPFEELEALQYPSLVLRVGSYKSLLAITMALGKEPLESVSVSLA